MTTTNSAVPPHIVVGIDGSAESKLALSWAGRISAATGASIEAVTAWQYPPSFGWAVPPCDWNPSQDGDKILTETVDEVFGAQRPANLQLSVRQGYPAHVLLSAAQGALMLVVGSRGHGGFAGMLLGSVSSNVAEHAHCPVLVVHPELAATEAR